MRGTLVVGSAKLRGVQQRAPPTFGRATVRLGVGSHFRSSLSFMPYDRKQLLNVKRDFPTAKPCGEILGTPPPELSPPAPGSGEDVFVNYLMLTSRL